MRGGSSMHVLVLVACTLAGCIGGYTPGSQQMPSPDPANPGPGPGTNAAQLFSKVSADLKSSCSSCHQTGGQGPSFLGDGPAFYYGKLTADARFVNAIPTKSELITQGPHEGPALTSLQAAGVLAWLTQELAEPPDLPQPP